MGTVLGMALLPSNTWTLPSGSLTAMKPPPAMDDMQGSATHAITADARHASTALPPAWATWAAASAPSELPAAIPSLAFVTNGGYLARHSACTREQNSLVHRLNR